MRTKPFIGLTAAYYNHKDMERSILGKSYTDSIQRAGGIPVIIPPVIDPSDVGILLKRLDGLLLTGGDDLNPASYGENSEPLTPKHLHPRRMTHDHRLFEYAWQQRLPTLGICLGLQEINVFLGGSLYQDIPRQLDNPLVHRIGEWFEARHPVKLEPGSLIHRVTGQAELDTNSAHHQAVKSVAAKLRVTGRSPDGMIEVLEPRDANRPLLAVQWHPESETNDLAGRKVLEWLTAVSSSF